MKRNLDPAISQSFGDERSRFDQSQLSDEEALAIFNHYFPIFPWSQLPVDACGYDMGCGSGRWARLVSPKVGHLHCIDPSGALGTARTALSHCSNVSFDRASVDDVPLPANSQDFGYSLGVLHHARDKAGAIRACVALLKPNAPFLIYLYYAFDNRQELFRQIWRMSDFMRRGICRLPPASKQALTDTLAALVYFPLAMVSRFCEYLGLPVHNVPLSYYRKQSFSTMRTDSRDRSGTPLERRFTKDEISVMLASAGLRDVIFSKHAPYWCAMGYRA